MKEDIKKEDSEYEVKKRGKNVKDDNRNDNKETKSQEKSPHIKEENQAIEGKDDKKEEESSNENNMEGCCLCEIVCEICGCYFYCERIALDEKKEEIKEEKNILNVTNENINIELNSIETNKEGDKNKKDDINRLNETKNNNTNNINSDINKSNSSEVIVISTGKDKESHGICFYCCLSCKLCCRLCCETINNYCNNLICNAFHCKEMVKRNICCSCCEYNEKHFNKTKQCFCYWYQERDFFYWINNFLVNKTQRDNFFCMLLYLISRLSSIGCEKQYENVLETANVLDERKVFITSYLSCFIVITFMIIIFGNLKYILEIFKDVLKELFEDETIIEDLTRMIGQCCFKTIKYCYDTYFKFLYKYNIFLIGIIIIFLFNISVALGHSQIILFGFFQLDTFNNLYDEEYVEKNYLYTTVFVNVYFVFYLNYYCSLITANKNGLEFLFTQTILVTVYLTIIDLIIYLIKFLIEDIKILFYIQFIVTLLIYIPTFFIFLRAICMFMSFCCKKCEYSQGICNWNMCCCNKNSSCYSECCNLRCSKCNCSYISFESCCSALYDEILG